MFTGRDYHHVFEEACTDLAQGGFDQEAVRGKLTRIECTLWEAIRGVFFISAVLIVLPPIGLAWYLNRPQSEGLVPSLWFGAAYLAMAVIVYAVMRLVFFFEVSRHITGRRFGA
jgi:hypothetical protein